MIPISVEKDIKGKFTVCETPITEQRKGLSNPEGKVI